MALIYCAQIDYYNPATSANGMLQVSTGSGFDGGAGVFFQPRLENPGQIAFSIRGAEGGRRASNWGDLVVSDPDGALTADLSAYFFDGRDVTVFTLDTDIGWGSYVIMYYAVVDTVAFDMETIRFRLRDRHIGLDQPFSDVKYLGDNSAGAGIEGNEELKDKHKPRILGRIAQMEAICVNPSKLIYQVNTPSSGASTALIANVVNVFDAGAYLVTRYNATNKQPVTYTGATAADQAAALEAAAPVSGGYQSAPRAGLLRLSAAPFGTITACVATSWDPADLSAAGLIEAILIEKGATTVNTSLRYLAADFTALDQKNAASLGVVVQDGETTASLLDRICQSVGAWWGFSPTNYFRVARFDGPAASPDFTLTDDDILNIERLADDTRPLWSVTVECDPNDAPQQKSALAGVVDDTRLAWLSKPARNQASADPSLKTARWLAEDKTIPSLLNGLAPALAEAQRRQALYSVRRDTVTVTLTGAARVATLDLGLTVRIVTPRLGYSAGRSFVMTGITADFGTDTLELNLWG